MNIIMARVLPVLLLSALILTACNTQNTPPPLPQNTRPVIASLTADPAAIYTEETTTLTVTATDGDGDPLTYGWSATDGSFNTDTGAGPVMWRAPNAVGTYTITVTVNDGKGGEVKKTVDVQVSLKPTWTVDATASALTTITLNRVEFANANEGWIVGGEESGPGKTQIILHYKNGSWANESQNFGLFALNDLTVLRADLVIAVGCQGNAVKWNGQNWSPFAVPYGCSETLHFVSETDGWVGPKAQNFMRHFSGGDMGSAGSWTQMDFDQTAYAIWDIDFISANDGWAVGDGGRIYHFTGSSPWKIVSSTTTKTLYSVQFTSADNGWAVGQTGTILHYSGGTWTAWGTSLTPWDLKGVHFTSPDSGWAVGQAGVILQYKNGSWASVQSPTSHSLNDVYFTDAENGWAAGSSGKVLRFGKP